MRVRPELDPDVDDLAPSEPEITVYDERHFVTYLRLLDAVSDAIRVIVMDIIWSLLCLSHCRRAAAGRGWVALH